MFKYIQLVNAEDMNAVVGQILSKFQGKAHTEYQKAMAKGLKWYDAIAQEVPWDPDTDGQVFPNEFKEVRPPALWTKTLLNSLGDLDGVEYLDRPLWVYESSHSGYTSVSIWAAGGRYAILFEGDDDSSFNPRLFDYQGTSRQVRCISCLGPRGISTPRTKTNPQTSTAPTQMATAPEIVSRFI